MTICHFGVGDEGAPFSQPSTLRVKHSVLPQPGKSLHCQIRPYYPVPVRQQSRNSKIIFNDLGAITLPRVNGINTCPRTNCC